MKKNRCLIILYLDLLVAYSRVMLLLETVEEKSTIAAMYTAAAYIAADQQCKAVTAEYTNKIKKLLDECSNLPRHFIDTFASVQSSLCPMLLELRDSLAAVNNVDELRRIYALNPIDQGDQMGAYAQRSVSRHCNCPLIIRSV